MQCSSYDICFGRPDLRMYILPVMLQRRLDQILHNLWGWAAKLLQVWVQTCITNNQAQVWSLTSSLLVS